MMLRVEILMGDCVCDHLAVNLSAEGDVCAVNVGE